MYIIDSRQKARFGGSSGDGLMRIGAMPFRTHTTSHEVVRTNEQKDMYLAQR